MFRTAWAIAAAASALLLAPTAFAQSSSADYRTRCEDDFHKSLAYTYLTGKPARTVEEIVTGGAKKLEINKAPLQAKLQRDSDRFRGAGFVSIPFSAVTAYARLSYTPVDDASASALVVCHYALKTSAKSWGNFQLSDLKALYGRRMEGITKGHTTSVRLGGSAPPAGYRTSTVAIAIVVHRNSTTPTVKLGLKTERR